MFARKGSIYQILNGRIKIKTSNIIVNFKSMAKTCIHSFIHSFKENSERMRATLISHIHQTECLLLGTFYTHPISQSLIGSHHTITHWKSTHNHSLEVNTWHYNIIHQSVISLQNVQFVTTKCVIEYIYQCLHA